MFGPLNKLLQKDRKWNWSSECNQAFERVKELVILDLVLCHFNSNLPVRVASDPSPYGMGAVIPMCLMIELSVQGPVFRKVVNLIQWLS